MSKFKPGDLVQFDTIRSLGVVLEIKKTQYLNEETTDTLVRWSNGEQFWCLECTLELISSNHN